jgi:hemerythrin-like domain-containing protein
MNDCLTNDHADLAELLCDLRTALDAGDLELSYARLDRFWARLAVHIRAEHLRLFPTILRALSDRPTDHSPAAPSLSQAQSTIEELHRDHDFFMHELARSLAAMRGLMATDAQDIALDLNEVRTRVAAVEERLVTHNTIEESQVYLWTSTLLRDEEQAALAKRLQDDLDNMPRRFTAVPKPNLM